MHPPDQRLPALSRRHFLGQSAFWLGSVALGSLLSKGAAGQTGPAQATLTGLPGVPHYPPKVRRVIYLMQSGAPSQVDLFDYKPLLAERRGQEIPASVHMGQQVSTMTANQGKPCLGSISPFRQHGQSGAWLSDFLPHTAAIADDLCIIKSMRTGSVNHAPAMTFLLTGGEQPGRPSMGAWLTYGLGSENENLPAFIVMTSHDREGTCGQLFFDFYWGSGFLPTQYQGVKLRSGGEPVLYLTNPPGMSSEVRRDILDGLGELNALHQQQVGDPEIATRIAQYEMAYRMQSSVPELADIANEPEHILQMYGPDVSRRGSFAYNCLMARRLAEQGVRFIQLMHSGWDQHQNLPTQLREQCRDTDQPSAALVQDLKQRGLLEDTLVIWGGEFGRTPFGQGDINNAQRHGRDHHPYCFTTWLAGGGIRAGITHGETDEFGYNIVRDQVHIHDLQATILHLLGIDHTRLTFRFQGRDYRLTDVHGDMVEAILA